VYDVQPCMMYNNVIIPLGCLWCTSSNSISDELW
jgi:hypothetical protein